MQTVKLDFESLVNHYYEPLYRFAMSLSGHADQAADLTQQTFYRALTREGQLRKRSKVKSWLFTILYREFLGSRRRKLRHPTQSLDESDPTQLVSESRSSESLDAQTLVETLAELDERHRVPLVLFYQEDYSYRQIADFLKVPMGTVMSRLNRGKHLLRERLDGGFDGSASDVARVSDEPDSKWATGESLSVCA
jgi:RNA polymerase sigma-70 factor (ECF subfamily)